jgi:hypothetical protein
MYIYIYIYISSYLCLPHPRAFFYLAPVPIEMKHFFHEWATDVSLCFSFLYSTVSSFLDRDGHEHQMQLCPPLPHNDDVHSDHSSLDVKNHRKLLVLASMIDIFCILWDTTLYRERERIDASLCRFEKWSTTVIPVYECHDSFVPTSIVLKHGETAPPPLLTESDLISKMDAHGIGTDATIAEHINTIQKRQYAVKVNQNTQFKPTGLSPHTHTHTSYIIYK